jgi:two-component system, OmpR family, sensor histidine kinase SenX3
VGGSTGTVSAEREQEVRAIRGWRSRLEAAEESAKAAQELASAADRRVAAAKSEIRRLRRALDALPLGVIVADGAGEVVFWNRQARPLAAPRHVDALTAQAVSELIEAARAGGSQTRTLELHGPPARTLELSADALGEELASGTVAVIQDVSDRRHLDAVRRDFVANVSHELRTPVGALGILAETLAGEDDPEVIRALAAHMGAEADRAARIIEDLLDLSRIEAGGIQGGAAAVAVGSVLAAAGDLVGGLATRRQVDVRLAEIPDDLLVAGDEVQLISAVRNLLDNAVKYSEPGSVVETEARRQGDWVELIVRDQGIGIPAKDLERIFERFYRVDRARSRETGGTGLGLAIVRHVAVNHGGEILVDSREGEGATFILRLPAKS